MKKLLAVAAALILVASYAWSVPPSPPAGDMFKSANLSGLASTSEARANIGVIIGSDIQAYNAALASIVGLTETSGGMPYFTASNTWAVLASGTAGQVLKMGSSYPEWTSSLLLSSLDLTSSVLALPQGTGAGYATDGYVYWRTDTNRLFIGDGTATRAVAFADEILAPSTVTFTAAQLYGSRINNYGQTAIATITLPTAAEGMDTVFVFGTATSATYTVQATGTNAMYYSGATAAGVRIAAPAVGNYFVLYSFKTGASAWSWILKDGQGTIATF